LTPYGPKKKDDPLFGHQPFGKQLPVDFLDHLEVPMKNISRAMMILMFCISLAYALIVMCIGWFGSWILPHKLLPLGRVGGVISSDQAVFIGSCDTGRVYKYDMQGEIQSWYQVWGKPIRIRQSGRSILIQYSGKEHELSEPAFRIAHDGPNVIFKHNWLGAPMLEIPSANGMTAEVYLQPWYLTVIQINYPGLLSWPLTFACAVLLKKSYRKPHSG
jgi:hypothetical protein